MQDQKTKQNEIDKYTIPQCVSVTPDPEKETIEQRVERQEKFLKLPESVKDKLVSYQTSKKIRQIGSHYSLSLPQLAPIARIVRSYYFGEVNLNKFPEILAKEIGIDLKKAENIARQVVDNIINQDVSPIKKNNVVNMTLRQALEKYPNIKQQVITDERTMLPGKPYPVKGTIENWIADYYNSVGAGNTDVMKRGAYLYNGKNSARLDDLEKQKLAFVLRALDENLSVEIDTDREVILFKSFKERNIFDKKRSFVKGKNAENKKNAMEKKYSSDKKKKNETAFGNKNGRNIEKIKRSDSFLKKKPSVKNVSFAGVADRNLKKDGVGKAKIMHKQGNDWDLGSRHFNKSKNEDKKNGFFGKMLGRKNNFDGKISSDGESDVKKGFSQDKIDSMIKFTSAQQLPVEKEALRTTNNELPKTKIATENEDYLPKFNKKSNSVNKTKKVSENNFFGKIGPIDE